MLFATILLLGLAAILAYAGFVTVKVSSQRDASGAYLMSAPLAILITSICVTCSALTVNAAFSL